MGLVSRFIWTALNIQKMGILEELLNEITPEQQVRSDRKMRMAVLIGDTIKQRGWSKREFALKVGRKPSEVSKWLSGTHNFTIETLIDIERVLMIELLNLTGKPKRQKTASKVLRASI